MRGERGGVEGREVGGGDISSNIEFGEDEEAIGILRLGDDLAQPRNKISFSRRVSSGNCKSHAFVVRGHDLQQRDRRVQNLWDFK